MDDLYQQYVQMGMWMQDHPAASVLIAVVALLIGDGIYMRLFRRRRGTTMPMTKEQRELFRKQCAADILTDGVELYVSEGVLKRADADKIYRMAAFTFKNTDLLPRTQTTMSAKIRNLLHKNRFWGYRLPKKPKEVKRRSLLALHREAKATS